MQIVKRTFEAPAIGFSNIEGQKFPFIKRMGVHHHAKWPKVLLHHQNPEKPYKIGKVRETLLLEDMLGDLWYSEHLDLFFCEKEKLEDYNFVFSNDWLTWTSSDGLRVYKTHKNNFLKINI